MTEEKSLFARKPHYIVFAVLAMFAWGCAFPYVKMGMEEFGIGTNVDKMVFAGCRFFLAGLVCLLTSLVMGKSIRPPKGKTFAWMALYGLENTTIHYAIFYIGLSNCQGSKASMIDSLSTFFTILFAKIFFKEKFGLRRVLGCLLVLGGVVFINMGGNFDSQFRLEGDGLLIISALLGGLGGILARRLGQEMEVMVATGYGLALGGGLLGILGLFMGGQMKALTWRGVYLMTVLVAISVLGFLLYNKLLVYWPVGKVAVFNGLIPVFGTLMSCLTLGEQFYFRYVFVLVAIVLGIEIINVQGGLQDGKRSQSET
ncbi:MAG: DMT family transporter [Eubacterium sp.]|nr:DMT family transporter [Eubacterium sp.]